MTTPVTTIISDAYRENNLLPVGISPTFGEQLESLRLLNNYINSLFGNEMGAELSDWNLPDPQRTASVAARFPQAPLADDLPTEVYTYPPANSRLLVKITSAFRVYFPENPSDGARMAYVDMGKSATLTFDGNGKLIDGATTKDTTTITTGNVWLYRADIGTWVTITALTADSNSPFPVEFDDLLMTGLNLRLCPRNGREPLDWTILRNRSEMSKFKARYRQAYNGLGGGAAIPSTIRGFTNYAEPATFNPLQP